VRAACEILEVTRQAYYKKPAFKEVIDDQVIQLVSDELIKARKRCPTRGCRSMYGDFGDRLPFGRDKSIAVFMDMGFRVRYPKRYGKATQSGTRMFPNLLEQKDVNDINQVWQADMAHYLYGETKLYTLLMFTVKKLLVMELMIPM
jgi:hypothetical protein